MLLNKELKKISMRYAKRKKSEMQALTENRELITDNNRSSVGGRQSANRLPTTDN
jgi:hypothetical protein